MAGLLAEFLLHRNPWLGMDLAINGGSKPAAEIKAPPKKMDLLLAVFCRMQRLLDLGFMQWAHDGAALPG
ncbi:hypothetical protein ACLOJK_034823, partial [Asimina triloba]